MMPAWMKEADHSYRISGPLIMISASSHQDLATMTPTQRIQEYINYGNMPRAIRLHSAVNGKLMSCKCDFEAGQVWVNGTVRKHGEMLYCIHWEVIDGQVRVGLRSSHNRDEGKDLSELRS